MTDNIVTYTSLNVVPENKKQFEIQIAFLATAIRNKKGCIKCQWFSNPEADNNYFMYIEFDNEENFFAYRQSKDVLEIIHTKTAPLLQTPPSFKYFRGRVFKAG